MNLDSRISIMKKHLILLLLLATCLGCKSEFVQLKEESGAAADAKVEKVFTAMKKVAAAPAASDAYTGWLAAKKQLLTAKSFAENEKLEDNVRQAFKTRMEKAAANEAERYQQAKLDESHNVYFIQHDQQNAATLILGEDNATGVEAVFNSRNAHYANWLVDGPPEDKVEDAKAWYQRVQQLRYLLVLRDVELTRPEFKGADDEGRNEFTRGSVKASAYLVDLESGEILTSFTFAAANKSSVTEFAGVDMFLSDDPDQAVKSLTARLYETAHDVAAASLAELSANVHSEYRHNRGQYLYTLERN